MKTEGETIRERRETTEWCRTDMSHSEEVDTQTVFDLMLLVSDPDFCISSSSTHLG